MNSAPAELLQLLTIAALQPSSARPVAPGAAKTWHVPASQLRHIRVAVRSIPTRLPAFTPKKKPPCLNKFRQCGSVSGQRIYA
jgi:hypothetical protein